MQPIPGAGFRNRADHAEAPSVKPEVTEIAERMSDGTAPQDEWIAGLQGIVGLLAAVYSGILVAVMSLLWHGRPRLGLLIGSAVFISVAWAAFLAVIIPGLMKRFRVNPAIASGPLVLALADFSTLLVYFGGATLFLKAMH